MRMEEERIPKKVLKETSATQDNWEDQETNGRTWSRGMH